MIAQYADLQREAELALEERKYRRRRMIAGIRGWLVRKHAPKKLTLLALLASALAGAAVFMSLHGLGLRPAGLSAALGVLAAWPAFVFAVWKLACHLFEREDVLADFRANHSFEKLIWRQENAALREPWKCPEEFEVELGRGFSIGLAAFPITIALTLSTLGTWLMWQLICQGSNLLAETIYDDCLARKLPKITSLAVVEDWRTNAFSGTALYFLGFALVIVPLGMVLVGLLG